MTCKRLILLCSLVSLLAAVNAAGQYSHIIDVSGTSHNLSVSGGSSSVGNAVFATKETEICFFCHAPHQLLSTADKTVALPPNQQSPLWNHYLSKTASYGVYSSTSFNALGTDITDLGGAKAGSAAVSNLCLSCHDGTVGVNTLYHGQYGTGSPAMSCNGKAVAANSPCLMPDASIIGNPSTKAGLPSLADLHPINFTYNAALAAKTVDLITPTVNASGIGGARMGVPGSVAGVFLPLFQTPGGGANYKMQCATCHDPHSERNGRPMLRDTTTASALCLDCHGHA